MGETAGTIFWGFIQFENCELLVGAHIIELWTCPIRRTVLPHLVGHLGVEPSTSVLSGLRSNQLS